MNSSLAASSLQAFNYLKLFANKNKSNFLVTASHSEGLLIFSYFFYVAVNWPLNFGVMIRHHLGF